jgi:hypothetical protein
MAKAEKANGPRKSLHHGTRIWEVKQKDRRRGRTGGKEKCPMTVLQNAALNISMKRCFKYYLRYSPHS